MAEAPLTDEQRAFLEEQTAVRPRTGPNNARVGKQADMSKACICKRRDPRAYLDDDGADFDCPHHGFEARKWVWP